MIMDSPSEITVRPIGQVRNSVNERMKHGWSRVKSDLVMEPDHELLLDGLEGFSHIIVLFWMHLSTGPSPAKAHPQGRSDIPLTGIFATRAPHRPNSIGFTVVRLLDRQGGTLKVKGLDAVNGTPLIDIKPYLPRDIIPRASFPEWVSMLDFT